MAIQTPDGPPEGYEVLRDHGFGSAGLFITKPHRVYTVTLDDLDRLLEAATPTSWRYLLVDDEHAHAAAEINDALQLIETNEGPFVEGTNAALVKAEQFIDGDFELRLLKVPAIYLVALWLHGESSDILLPLAPTPAAIEAERAYSPDELRHLIATQ